MEQSRYGIDDSNDQDTSPLIFFEEEDEICQQINQKLYGDDAVNISSQKFLLDQVQDKLTQQLRKQSAEQEEYKGSSNYQEEFKQQSQPQYNLIEEKNQGQYYTTQNYKKYSSNKNYNTQNQYKVYQQQNNNQGKKQTYSSYKYPVYQPQQYQQYYQQRQNNNNQQSNRYGYQNQRNQNDNRQKYNNYKIYNPDKTRFNYKPSSYNYYSKYQNRKYKDYYNDYTNRYGMKIRRVNINDINGKINNKKINNQYWRYRNKYGYNYNNNNQDQSNKYNNIINNNQKKPIKLPDQNKDIKDSDKIYISNLLRKFVDKKKQEEQEQIDQQQKQKDQKITNQIITTFKKALKKNQLDDLNTLLKTSQKYQQAKRSLRNGKYTDPDFPPNEYSIYGFGDRKDYSLQDLRQLPWYRPETFFKGKNYSVYNTIDSGDIEQGGLGDCYFLAAISSIAEYPERLERIFLTKQVQQNGIYVLALCLNGIWQDVILDDCVPCTKYSKSPAFNRSSGRELWVILLEKAWAKVHGGYMNIAAGLTREALRDLTGASAITYFTSQNPEQLWERLVQANYNKFIITAGSDNLNSGSDAYIEKIGIAGSHAYSLLEVIELCYQRGRYRVLKPQENKQGLNVERLVKLRNPWGKGEWKGDWADDSFKWTDQLKLDLDFEQKDDGIFYMTYNDFLKYYSDIQICYYHDDYKYSAIEIQSDQKMSSVIKITIYTKGKYYFSLNQKNRRFFPKHKKYRYSDCSYIVAKLMKNGHFDFIGGSMRADKENWIAEEVEPGDYFIQCNTPWQSFVNEYSFSIYGPSITAIDLLSQNELPENFNNKLFISHYKEHPHDMVQNFASQGHPDITYTTFDNKGGYGYIAFENKSQNSILEATVDMLGSVNIELIEPYSGLKPSVEVSPGEIEVICYRATKLPYTTSMRMLSIFKNVGGAKDFKEQVRQSSTILKKTYQGQTVDIKVYILYHQDGLALLYVNNTRDYTIDEEIEFDMTNCYIEGTYGSYLEVCVKPGRERLIKIVKDEDASNYNVKISKLYYKIIKSD